MVAVPDPGQILKWLDGPIDLKVEVDTPFLDQGDFALYDVSVYDTDTYGTSDPEWTDVSRYVLQVSSSIGRGPSEERFASGTGTFIMDNTEGIWTPDTNLPTPWYLPWRPGRRIRLIAIPDPDSDPLLPESKVALWTGEVSEATDQFADGGHDIETVVMAVDFMGRLSRINPLALETPTGVQSTSARVHAALDRADWPMDQRAIQAGFHTMQSSHLAQSVLEECHMAAESEGGAFFVSPDGVATFKNRDWLNGATILFEDDFTGTVIDTAKWNDLNLGTDAYAVEVTQNDALYIVHDSNYEGLTTDETFDLTNATITWRMDLGEATTDDWIECRLAVLSLVPSTTRIMTNLYHDRFGGADDKYLNTAGFGTFIEYDPDIHKWFRMDFNEGVCTYQWSTDGVAFTTWASLDHSATDWTAARIELVAGEGGTTTVTTPAMFDNLKVTEGYPEGIRSTEPQGFLGYDDIEDLKVTLFEDDFTGTVIDTAKWTYNESDRFTQDDVLKSHVTSFSQLISDDLVLGDRWSLQFEIVQVMDAATDADYAYSLVNLNKVTGPKVSFSWDNWDGSSPDNSTTEVYLWPATNDGAVWESLFSDGGPPIVHDANSRWVRIEAHPEGTDFYTAPNVIGPWTLIYSSSQVMPGGSDWAAVVEADGDNSGTTQEMQLDNVSIANLYPDAPTAHILDVKPSWETARIRNDVQLALIGGVAYQVEDSASIALYDRRSHRRFDYQNNVQAHIEFLADRKLAAWKDNRMRVDYVSISANQDLSNEDLNRLFWDSRIGDLISVKVKTGQGWEYEKIANIVGIAHWIDSEDWVVTFVLDDFATV